MSNISEYNLIMMVNEQHPILPVYLDQSVKGMHRSPKHRSVCTVVRCMWWQEPNNNQWNHHNCLDIPWNWEWNITTCNNCLWLICINPALSPHITFTNASNSFPYYNLYSCNNLISQVLISHLTLAPSMGLL